MTGRSLRLFGIPAISVRALAAFRAILGASLFLIVLTHPIGAVPFDAQRVYSPLVAAGWVRMLSASEVATSLVHLAALAAAAAFAIGWLPRASFVALVSAIFLRTLIILQQAGAHDWGTPLITLLGLLVVPWNDPPPIYQSWTHDRPLTGRGQRSAPADGSVAYGFAIWLPGLTIGLAFAAAALEKLRQSGLDWITNGTVRYHFVEDSANAPLDLGLWIATQPRLAVLLSLGGILIEAAFIGIIFVRRWQSRAAFGLAAAGLMVGFWIFQGVHWWPWLMLLTAFLPWNRGAEAAGAGPGLKPIHGIVIVLLIAGQVWASYRRVEIEPLLSHYPMYAGTYESAEAFDRAHTQLRFRADGTDITDRVRAVDGYGVMTRALDIPADARQGDEEISAALAEFRRRYAARFGAPPAALDGFRLTRPFDWQSGRFKPEVLEPIGRVELVPQS
jgi:hypothetical protein